MTSKKRNQVDYIFLILTGVLLLIGLVMLWSASTTQAEKDFGNNYYYVLHQLLYGAAIGLVAMYALSRIDYHFWKKLVPVGLIFSFLALIMVKVPGIGFSAGGASRWIHLGPIFFQPSEIAKLSLILYLAAWISERGTHKSFRESVVPPLVMTGLFAVLILWQPDMGTMLSLCITAMVILFVGGIRLKYVGWILLGGVLSLLALIKLEPYRARRITAFLNRSADPLGIAYQINQALLAIGTGGWFGYGYGASREKHFYLPEPLNDSIFAVIAEELGFLRVGIILLIFLAFLIRGLQISMRASDNFGKIFALGIIVSIGANVVVNISAILGLVPLTGIPLPFFSYGSTSLIVTLASIGIVLNISRTASKAA